ncbi:hypothetical protein M407DRAFT_218876 [Tulasnella calospora MUT 4182]|uniref:F-box domain-containing protein n=1 Tax=Tulasnella calospora MUT 4182 TaxID=1051891 RepID=A0A0C3QI60_9AGAM|nr:hypothetical protein M407DRAFT_218876 [Tulasnella calospora MUT 4182]
MSKNQPFHVETRPDAPTQRKERPFIDLLPIELLEQVISLGVDNPGSGRSTIKCACLWRTVSRRWKYVIDDCASLWTSIFLRNGTENLKPQLEKSKGALLDIQILRFMGNSMDCQCVQLVIDNAHRWRTLAVYGCLQEFAARLELPPSILTDVEIQSSIILRDCKLFTFVGPNLRRLTLTSVVIAHDFDPPVGLEDLQLVKARERSESGSIRDLPANKFHQFLNANPNLRILRLGAFSRRARDRCGLQPVNLPKLEKVTLFGSQVFGLFWAEHCLEACLTLRCDEEKPPLGAWTTFVHGLRKAERVEIGVCDGDIFISTVGGPSTIEISLNRSDPRYGSLRISILEDFLNEAEKDAHISAPVELGLLTRGESGSNFDFNLEVLKLLQTPVSDSLSGKSRWRIPNLHKIVMNYPAPPYHHLQAFIQARSNGCCIQPASPITSISIHSFDENEESFYEEVLDKVMACAGGGNDG